MLNYPTYNTTNPYMPYNYTRPYIPTQAQPVNVAPTQTQPQTQVSSDFPLKFANAEEAKAFMVFPNQRQFFINNEKNELYVKSADAMGQSFFDEYIITPKNKAQQTTTIEPTKVEDIVTKEDLNNYVSKDYVSALEKQINTLNTKVEKALRLGELITPKGEGK